MPAKKTIEVDEDQFLASQQLVKTVQALQSNPKARKFLDQAVKTINPEAVTVSSAQDEVLEEVNKVKAETEALKKQIAEEKASLEAEKKLNEFKGGIERQKDKLRAEGWQDEGLEKVENLMQERGIADFEAAAALFERLNPPPAPISGGVLGITPFDHTPEDAKDAEAMKKLIATRGDDPLALNHFINAGLTEVRSGNRR